MTCGYMNGSVEREDPLDIRVPSRRKPGEAPVGSCPGQAKPGQPLAADAMPLTCEYVLSEMRRCALGHRIRTQRSKIHEAEIRAP
jgi:hypothetical protein